VAEWHELAPVAGYAVRDATFKQVYDQWSNFRSEVLSWNQTNRFKLDQFIGRL